MLQHPINQQEPIFILKGIYFNKLLAFFILVLASIGSFLLVNRISFIMIIAGLYFLAMTVFIKFPRIELFSDHFTVIQKSILNYFTDKEIYYFKDIKNVGFEKGCLNIMRISLYQLRVFGILFSGSEQVAQKDRMVLVKTNNTKKEIYRIGKRYNFIQFIDLLSDRLSTD